MKKLLLLAVFTVATSFLSSNLKAQTLSFDSPLIWGTSPFQDSIWAIDTTNWQVVQRSAPTIPGFTVTGITGFAMDPTTGISYVVAKVSGVTGRVLATIDLGTSICTPVNGTPQASSLGTNFSSITFDDSGQMYGATGDGATPSETLYLINKTNATLTLLFAMSNGADGEIILYNRSDDHMYHWSGNGTVVMEKWPITNVTYSPVSISASLGSGEIFGGIYNGGSKLILSTISSNFRPVSTSGVMGSSLTSLPDDLRGLVMLPYFTESDDSICQNEMITITGGGHQYYDNLIYHWGDGNTDTLAVTNGVLLNGTHMYATQGNYTIYVETDNGIGGDTVYSFVVDVANIPVVTLSGNATVCSGDSVTLVATSGGTSQWYMNGVLIPGATSNAYTTDQPGIYNMIKTNLNGCSDSATVGIEVITSSYPIVDLGNDTTLCDLYTLNAGNSGVTFLWSTGDSSQVISLSSSAAVSVMVGSGDGCFTYDTVNVTINASPVVNVGADTSDCVSVTVDAGNPGASYLWCDGSTTQTVNLTSSGTCMVMVTDTNGCSANDTINVTIFGNPTVSLSAMLDSMCLTTPPVVLSGSPAGGSFSGVGTSPNTFTPTTAGAGVHTAYYMFTDTNGCSATDSVMLTVFADPTVTATASPSTVCVDDADVALTGSPAGGTFSGTSVTGSNFDPSVGAGNYNITYTFTDVNGCSGTDVTTVQVNACVGIEETTAATFTLFPNPSTGMLNLNLPEADATVEVMDVLGNVVAAKQFNNSGVVQLDLSAQPNGFYFVRVNGTNAQRLVIQK